MDLVFHPKDDYSARYWIFHEWLEANGPLTEKNVFDYFSTSMFYDKQCNNQVLRMQTMHTGTAIANEAEELRRFTGLEFAVVNAQPPSLFVIHKRERRSPDEVRPLAAYFIMNNCIYQAPDLYTVLSNRLLTTINCLQSSLEILRSHKPDYTPRAGFLWPISNPEATPSPSSSQQPSQTLPSQSNTDATQTASQASNATSRQQRPTTGKRKEIIEPLANAVQTTTLHLRTQQAAAESASLGVSKQPATSGPPSVGPSNASDTTVKRSTPVLLSTSPTAPGQPGPKGPPGGGKKKKKRTSVAPPTM